MQHYTYWIIDHVNKWYYHGVHSSAVPEDIRAYHGSSNLLNEAIRRYGIERFEKRVERVFPSREAANAHEVRVHRRLNVAHHPRFYNCINARPFLAVTPGPLSERHMARLFSPEARAKNARAHRGIPHPKDAAWRKKVSDAKKGIPLTESHKAALRGVPKTLSDEQRQVLRDKALERTKPGTSNPLHHAKVDGYIVWKAGRAREPAQLIYVLNVAAFARQVLGVKNSLSSKLAEISDGRRNSIYGYVCRRPSAIEVALHKQRLLTSGDPYVVIGEGVAGLSKEQRIISRT